MQGLLINILLAVLEKLIVKGTIAFQKYMELKAALEENEKKAQDYQKVVDDPKATREDRKKAEDELLS